MTRGLARHGIGGLILVLLVITHHLLNAAWYRTLSRGRWRGRRFLVNATGCLLVAVFLAFTASALAMAGDTYPFFSFPYALLGPRPAHRYDSLALCPCLIPSRSARRLCLEQGGTVRRPRPVSSLPYLPCSGSFLLRSEWSLERYAVSGRAEVLPRGDAGFSGVASWNRVFFLPAGETFRYPRRKRRAALRVGPRYPVPAAANHVFLKAGPVPAGRIS